MEKNIREQKGKTKEKYISELKEIVKGKNIRKQKEEKQKVIENDDGIIVFDKQNCIEQLIINLIEQKIKILLQKFCDANNLEIKWKYFGQA